MRRINKLQLLGLGPNSKLRKLYKDQFIKLTPNQKDILIGILLGDGYIFTKNKGKTHGIKFEWGLNSYSYINQVYNVLYDYIYQPPKLYTRINANGNIVKTWRMETFSSTIFNELGFLLLDNNFKKEIKDNLILNHLSPISLAYWYMDDGSRAYYKNKRSLTDKACILNTQGFKVYEVELLIKELNIKYDLDCFISFNHKKPIIYIPNKSYYKFYNLINPYILPLFRYKLPSI